MFDETRLDPACSVCERRLLPGERPIVFLTGDGEEVEVCELCKPRAEAAGWLRPEEVAEAGETPAGNDRRRNRSAQVLGGLLSRRQPPAADSGPQPDRRAPEHAPDPDFAPEPELEPAPLSAETTVGDAVYAFNHSDHRRTVAGLTRTLGTPRATALVRKGNGAGGVRLTIAWELTWYQWEVSQSGRGHEVRESGKGDTIDQLGSADRTWNLMVAADGTLEEKTASSTPVEEG